MDYCDIARILAIGYMIMVPLIIILFIILIIVIVKYRFKGKLNPKTGEVSTELTPEEKVKIKSLPTKKSKEKSGKKRKRRK